MVFEKPYSIKTSDENQVYIWDEHFEKSYSFTGEHEIKMIVDLLNHKEKIIYGKSTLIKNLSNLNNTYAKRISGLEKELNYYKNFMELIEVKIKQE